MKLLIIGCKGFIGSNAVQYFSEKGDEIIGFDLLDEGIGERYPYYKRDNPGITLAEIFNRHRPDACINAGGNGSVPLSITDPKHDFDSNVLIHSEILEIIRQFKPDCKYIHMSSAAVYGSPVHLPISETSPVSPISPYGWHKYQAELICREYATLYKIPVASLRVFSVYGPGLRKQIFWDTYQKSKSDEPIRLFGTGAESRDFIYITDLVEAMDIILDRAVMNGQVINVSSGIETTIAEAIGIFTGLLNHHKVIFTHQDNPGNPLNWKADISLLQGLGFTAKTYLPQGLNKTVQWLKENG
jgi:UDP-glucose 4-epimerase